jgi:hypothetical protein
MLVYNYYKSDPCPALHTSSTYIDTPLRYWLLTLVVNTEFVGLTKSSDTFGLVIWLSFSRIRYQIDKYMRFTHN